jgi:hypothetical protein
MRDSGEQDAGGTVQCARCGNLGRVAAKIDGLARSSYKYVCMDKMVYINVAIEPMLRGHVHRDA